MTPEVAITSRALILVRRRALTLHHQSMVYFEALQTLPTCWPVIPSHDANIIDTRRRAEIYLKLYHAYAFES